MPPPPANAPLFLDSSAPESLRYRGRAEVAQLVEHSTENAGVAGSIPALGTRAARSRPSGSSSVVEHFLAKEEVAGSNPVSRSTAQRAAACRCRRRGVAQLVARVVRDDEVAGSSPVTPTTLPRPRAAAISHPRRHSRSSSRHSCVGGNLAGCALCPPLASTAYK